METIATHTATCRSCGARVVGTLAPAQGLQGPGISDKVIVAPAHECATHIGFVRTDSTPKAL